MLHLFSEVLSLLLAFNNAFHRVSLVFFGAWYQHNLFFPSLPFFFKPFFFSCFRCFARATGVFSTSTSFTPFSASQMFYSGRARNVCVFSCYQRGCSEWKNCSRLFFFFACKISLSFSKSVHALAHFKFTFPNTNDQNTFPILTKNFTSITRWRYRGGQTDSLLTSYVSSASGRNFSEFALRLTKYGNQAEINKTDNHLFTNTANTFGHCK